MAHKRLMSKSLGIYYMGGCGGYFAFWHVLLGSNYRCSFHGHFDDYDLMRIKDWQWRIDTPDNWKNTEMSPLHDFTDISDFEYKVYLYCNPDHNNYADIEKHDTNIYVYTDIDLQIEMCRFKKANMFRDHPELYDSEDALLKYKKNNSMKYEKQHIWRGWLPILAKIDHKKYFIDLKTIASTQGQSILDLVQSKKTKHNIEFNNHWLSLHTPELQNKFKKKYK